MKPRLEIPWFISFHFHLYIACGYAPAGLILKAYAKSHGGFSGKLIVTPSAFRDHTRLDSEPNSPILAISPW